MSLQSNDVAIEWLLRSDPSIRWQVMRDLLNSPEDQWKLEREKVEHQGWGKKMLDLQDDDGQWAGGAFSPADMTAEEWNKGQAWTATSWSLDTLRELGLDPLCKRAQDTVELVRNNSRWDHAGQPFWEGEVEECINGRLVSTACYYGVDASTIVKRLLGEMLKDGGWNCDRADGSVRSSFHTTLNVLEGLLAFENATGGTPESVAARKSGEEYLLKRNLFRRLSTGEIVKDEFLRSLHQWRWRYTILRALGYFRAVSAVTGGRPDPRLKEAVEIIRNKRNRDGLWELEWDLPGRDWFKMNEQVGKPSVWVTLYALRVLKWWDEATK